MRRITGFLCCERDQDLCWRSGIQQPPPPEKVEPVATMVSGMRCCRDLRLGFLSPKSPQRSVQAVQSRTAESAPGAHGLDPRATDALVSLRRALSSATLVGHLVSSFESFIQEKDHLRAHPRHSQPSRELQPLSGDASDPAADKRIGGQAASRLHQRSGIGRRGRESAAASMQKKKRGRWCLLW